MMMLFKGFLLSVAGPAPNYDMQRILSTRNPREASMMSAVVNVVLNVPRYFMITGLTILALVFYSDKIRAMGAKMDFEMVLPDALSHFVPVGLLGVLVAGLLAAFMSNFAATVNSAPPYLVNDIYRKFINPQASERACVRLSYVASFAVVALGISIGWFVGSIDSVIQWIVSALWGGYTAANVLKWYWWRFNGYGYFWGMVAGIAASMILPVALPHVRPLNAFPLILVISTAGCLLGTFLTKPEDDEVLKAFYRRVRPWGFWGPVLAKVQRGRSELPAESRFRARHVQRSRGHRLADQPGCPADLRGDSPLQHRHDRAGRGPGNFSHLEVHLVRPPDQDVHRKDSRAADGRPRRGVDKKVLCGAGW